MKFAEKPAAAIDPRLPAGPQPSALRRLLLGPLAGLYGWVIKRRNKYYHHDRRSRRVSVPVISIGNLTVGGTGKTPVVIEVVQRLQSFGRRPAVLTRGYRGKPGADADEVLELRAALPGVPVVVNADRVAGAAQAIADGADCCVLDDGFQHRRIYRDLNLVLIDALDPWGGGRLLPVGRLREPLRSARRANGVIITRSNQVSATELEAIRIGLQQHAPDTPVLRAAVKISRAVTFSEEEMPLAALYGWSVVPVSALGNPSSFERLVAGLCRHAPHSLRFRDHHRYSAADAQRIMAVARQCSADAVVTTRKDWVKLREVWPRDDTLRLVRLEIVVELLDPTDTLDRLLREAVGATA